MNIESLHLELTRNCPIECEHCLRGDRQIVNMDPNILDKVFEDIDTVEELLLTGGEPFINIQAIERLIEILKSGRVKVNKISIVTSGAILNDRILNALAELSKYTNLVVRVSDNIFHRLEFDRLNITNRRNNNVKIMSELDIPWDFAKDYVKEDYKNAHTLYKQGRAAKLTDERLAEINAMSYEKYVFHPFLTESHPITMMFDNYVVGNITVDVYGYIVRYGQTYEDEDKEAIRTNLNVMQIGFVNSVIGFVEDHYKELEGLYKKFLPSVIEDKKLRLENKLKDK